MKKEIELFNLPKVSLNKWYAGQHWTIRKKTKDIYKSLVKSQFKHVFGKGNTYTVDYVFNFKSRPLDATNCVAMTKLIEDIIFEDDKFDIILKVSLKSVKSKKDSVKITVFTQN